MLDMLEKNFLANFTSLVEPLDAEEFFYFNLFFNLLQYLLRDIFDVFGFRGRNFASCGTQEACGGSTKSSFDCLRKVMIFNS